MDGKLLKIRLLTKVQLGKEGYSKACKSVIDESKSKYYYK